MKNEYKVTKELMMSWAKEYHLHGAASIIFFILHCFIGVCGLCLLLLNIFIGDWRYYFLAAVALFISIFRLLFSRFFVLKNRYKIYSKTYGVTEWMRTTEFTDEAIVITDHTAVNQVHYENIEKIKEMGNCVILFLNHNMGVRIYKDAFVEGTWEECREKINAKRE